MIKRNIEQLAVYQLGEEAETLLLTNLRNCYLEKTSEIVYITKDNKLYGIVSMGDVLHHSNQGGGEN